MGNKYIIIAFDGNNGFVVVGWATAEEIAAKVGPIKTLARSESSDAVLEFGDLLAVPMNVTNHYELNQHGEYEDNIFRQVQNVKERNQMMGDGPDPKSEFEQRLDRI